MVRSYNDFWRILIAFCNQQLSLDGRTEWVSEQTAQPTFQSPRSKSVIVHRISSRRYGFQGRRDVWDKDALIMRHYEDYIEELRIQINCYKKRIQGDATMDESGDVLHFIATSIMSFDGLEYFRQYNMGPLRIINIVDHPFTTGTDFYEKMPRFDVVFSIAQSRETTVQYTNTVEGIVEWV